VGAGLVPTLGIWAGIGTAAIGLGLAALWFAGSALRPLLRPSGWLLVWGVAAGIGMLAATYGLYPRISAAFPAVRPRTEALYALLHVNRPLWVTWVLLPVIILSEELVWRGVVFAAVRRRMALVPAILSCAALYALGHAPVGSLLLAAVALACGLFWSVLRAGSGSLLPALICHLIWDLFVFILQPLA
jgi:membrane protease YdiL (CAAX protease family)